MLTESNETGGMNGYQMQMTIRRGLATSLLVSGLVCAAPVCLHAEPRAVQIGTTALSDDAERILRAMSDYLAEADQFTFRADVTYDSVVDESYMVQYGGVAHAAIMRPGRLRAEYRGDERQSTVILNDGSGTIHDIEKNLYSTADVPTDLDGAMDHLFDTYGFSVPISDFVYSDPYDALVGYVDSGFSLGIHTVGGTPCHHLVFTQETIDWQIWIDAGPQPVPRKLVITYKDEAGFPQYTARLSEWNLDAHVSPLYFEFDPPAGADRIEFMPLPDDFEADETETTP